jgi:hypothetical protein
MMSLVLLLAGLAVFLMVALRLRMQGNLYRQEQALSSPLAEAMSQLVGIAGGIYLSLVMLVSFLGIETPQKICFLDMLLDPLALLSILLACLQPLGLLFLQKLLAGGGKR